MPSNVFNNIFFYMSKTLPGEQSKTLSKVLCLNGAVSVELDDERLTHFITNSIPGEDSLEILPESSQAALVTSYWAERSLVLSALQDPAFYSPDPTMLFSGIVATSTNLSQTDNEVLCAGITSLGGQWRTAFTKDVTHMFAMSDDSAKYATAMHFRQMTGVLILVPHWFDDVVRLGMRNLPTEEYEWPEPKVFSNAGVDAIKKLKGEEGEDQKELKKFKPLTPHKKALYDTALVANSDLPAYRPASSNVWDGMKILLSFSLGLSESQYEAHVADIERSGGVVVRRETPEEEVERVAEADALVTKYRSGPAYAKAYRLSKTIGTLPWLWYVRATGLLSRPTDQLLHYPVPRGPVENFSHHVITITNYTGKDREYIKKLIVAMGAEFTPSMTGRNTILIAAYISGTKTTKATSWNIPIVNHLWLEDCFVQWRDVSTANEKYIHFPPGIDFGTVLGDKGVGRVGYDAEELAALEKEVVIEENADASIRPPLASQTVIESPKRRKDKVRTPSKPAKEDEDVVMAADISAGGYLDIDVPLDDNGRLSDIEIVHEEEGQGDESEMDVDDSPSLRKSTRIKAATKPPATPKSILKRSAKAKPAPPAESEPEEEVVQPSSPSRPKRKLVRRFGQPGSSATPAQEESKKASPKSPKTPRRQNRTKADAKGREEASADEDFGEGPSSRKLLVKKTYGAKSRSRSRSRARNDEESEVEPTSRKARASSVRSRSRSRSRAREVESGDKPIPPKRTAKSSRARSTSRGRGRKQSVESEDEEEEDDVPQTRTPAARGRPVSRGRPPTRQQKVLAEEVEQASSSKKASRVIITRSRSRSRLREAAEDASPPKSKQKTSASKGKGKSGQEDSDMDDVVEIPKPAAKTPVKAKSESKAALKRKKPTVPTDTESEVEPPPKRTAKRKASLASVAETEGDAQKKRSESQSRRTPRRDVSVVLPTLKQRPLNLLLRSLRLSVVVVRPPTRSVQTTTKQRSPPSDDSPPPPPPKNRRRPTEPVAEAGPSNLPDTPASSTRSPSKRSAATKATKKLHDVIMPDVVNFQKELKSGHVKSAYDREQAGSKGSGKEKESEHTSVAKGKKRRSMDDGGASADEEPEKKKTKVTAALGKRRDRRSEPENAPNEEPGGTHKHPAVAEGNASPSKGRNIVVLTTQVTFDDDVTRALTKMGAKFTQKPSECTHLVAKHFVRTEKFLCGMAVASYVVNDKWVEMSAIKKRFLPEADYALKDSANEAKYGVKLIDALRRAKKNAGTLFQGMTFYVTPKVPVDIKLLKNVVAVGGGQVSSQTPTARILKGHENRYVISHQSDMSIWRPLAQHGYTIYSQELILTGALKQEIDWESDSNKVPGSY
ncbi:hypothetical protein NM688_g5307 [Phlebia brevispora]|uniref:Uncharacterized protein n=1 Tax=Phlebia brevispora TaxID=194682 RepID=A0ACC1SX89_9APHY|nr:hypothetical protein NM688_g5307 [Phlebia brevispora]